jgi:hypothetical protein
VPLGVSDFDEEPLGLPIPLAGRIERAGHGQRVRQPDEVVAPFARRRVVVEQLEGSHGLVQARRRVAAALEDGREDQVAAGEQRRRPVLSGPAVDLHGQAGGLGGLAGTEAHVRLDQPAPHLEIGSTDRRGFALDADRPLQPVFHVEGAVELERIQKPGQPRSRIDPSPAFHHLQVSASGPLFRSRQLTPLRDSARDPSIRQSSPPLAGFGLWSPDGWSS